MKLYLSRNTHQKGFTLIELIVALGLFMLAIGGVLANYNGFHARQKVKQAALTFKEHLRFAQSQAISGKKPTEDLVTCSGTNTLDGHRVAFTNDRTYVIVAVCSDNESTDVQPYTLPAGITVSPETDITFRSLSGKLYIPADITYTLTGENASYNITVSSSGDITDSGFVPVP